MAKSYRKFLAGAATTAVVASSFAGAASAASLSDIKGLTHEKAINALVDQGVIKGFPDGTFKPENNIKRGDAAVMIARALNLLDGKNIPQTTFTDLGQVKAETQEAIAKLASRGYISGFDTQTFAPNEPITRAQMAKLVAKAYDIPVGDGITKFTDVNPNGALAPFVDALADAGIAQGKANGSFGYHDQLNRGDFAAFVYRAQEAGDVEAVNPISIEAADNKGNSLKNDEKKTYTVTVTNPVSGKPVPYAAVNVTFAENVGTNEGSKRNVTVTDAYGNVEGIPYQADEADGAIGVVVVTTDQHGKATFTITGNNASVTPIAFLDGSNQEWDTKGGIEIGTKDGRFDENHEFFAKAETVSFSLETYELSVSAKGDKFAALAEQVNGETQHNGREYTVTVLKDDGQPFAGGTVHVGINELLDQEPGNDSEAAYLVVDGESFGEKTRLKLDSKGQAKVTVASTARNDFASPIFWVEQNNTNDITKAVPNSFESSVVGETTNFQFARVAANGKLEVKDLGLAENVKEFKFTILNQSGKEFPESDWRDKDGTVTFEVKNTGSHPVDLDLDGVTKTVQPNKTVTLTSPITNDITLEANSVGGPSKVEVSANAVIEWYEGPRSQSVAVTAPAQTVDLLHSVDVEADNSPLQLKSVTPEDKDETGVYEQFVFEFNKAVSGVEAEDFRLNGNIDFTASEATVSSDGKEVIVKFSETDVLGANGATTTATINYDGKYANGAVVIVDGFGNKVKPFDVPLRAIAPSN